MLPASSQGLKAGVMGDHAAAWEEFLQNDNAGFCEKRELKTVVLVQESVPHRILNQLAVFGHAHLLQHPNAVSAHRALADG